MRKDLKVSFRLKPGRDYAIIDWLESLSEHDRSYYIRESLRAYLSGQSPQVLSGNKASKTTKKPAVRRKVEKVKPVRDNMADSPEIEDRLEQNLNSWFD